MASFTKDSELKNLKLGSSKNREWIKDASTPYLYIYATKTQKGLTKTFIFRYVESGSAKRTPKQIIIGKYPHISLADARTKANEITKLKMDGKDLKAELAKAEIIKFKDVSAQWIDKERTKGGTGFNKQVGRVNNHLLPYIGERDISTLTKRELTALIDRLQEHETKSGRTHDTSKRVFWLLRQIMDFATDREYINKNPIYSVKFSNAFKTSSPEHFKAITDPGKLRELLLAFEAYQGSKHTQQALIFSAHTFLRSANVRGLKWRFIDFDKNLIIFPAKEMKLKTEFVMPMSRQVKKLLQAQREIVAYSDYVFPSDISSAKPLSENTLNYAIKRLGFGDELVFHGLRSTASTLLNENISKHGLDSEVIELCLDHKERNKVKAIYDRSQRLEDRAQLMQWWSDYLENLKMKG